LESRFENKNNCSTEKDNLITQNKKRNRERERKDNLENSYLQALIKKAFLSLRIFIR